MSCNDKQVQKHAAGGTLISFKYVSEYLESGSERDVTVYIPKGNRTKKNLAMQVYTDGMRDCEPAVLEKLVAEKAVPPIITIGVKPGVMPSLIDGGTSRRIRSIEYDSLGPHYANFIIDEVIPTIKKEVLPNDLTLSDSYDMHSICGCSSGGICSWNACWERNDYFRRCLINSPTFSSFRGGEELLAYMRKYETKPIRCFMTAGTDDMRNSAGDWHLEALTAKEAMEYGGYEYDFELFEGGKHGVGSRDADVMERGLRFIWKDWKTKPVGIRHLPERVADIVTMDSSWKEDGGDNDWLVNVANYQTSSPYGTYYQQIKQPKKIYLRIHDKKKCVAKLDFAVAGMALSCDQSLLYVCSIYQRFVYAFRIAKDGSLHDMYPFARLHVADDLELVGATSICVDDQDRLYAATDLGIQTFSWEGHCNCILPLPNHATPFAIGFSQKKPNQLRVMDLDGNYYVRDVLTHAPQLDVVSKPGTPLY
ncbi:MAG: hypothetical protein IKS92_01300 [Victivallales bacterium]|nr:hypothetical protein [Victivallales bacterium]